MGVVAYIGSRRNSTATAITAASGHTVDTITSSDWPALDLSAYVGIVLTSSNPGTDPAFGHDNPVHVSKLAAWILGGGIFVVSHTASANYTTMMGYLDGTTLTLATDGTATGAIVSLSHPFFTTPNALTDSNFTQANGGFDYTHFDAPYQGYQKLMLKTGGTLSLASYRAYGDGFIVLLGQNDLAADKTGYDSLMGNIFYNLSLGVSGLIGAGTETGTPGSTGADETGFFCPAEGSVVESTGHSQFGAALALDLEAGKAYRWTNLPFTCGLTVPQTCAASFEKPDGLYFGTRNSRVAIFGRENVYSDGPWQNMVSTDSNRLTVTAGAAGTVTVSETLSVYGDRLAGMTCTLIKNYGTSSETRQERTILTNSATVILVSWALTGEGENWTSNPASGDVLIIGLIRPYIEPMEIHTADASYPGSLRADYNLESSSITSATIAFKREIYTASGRRKSVGTSRATPAATRISTLDEFDNEPEGMGITPAAGFKAHIERDYWDQPACELVFRQLEKDVVK